LSTTILLLLATEGAFGAFDTLWFHEWRARLPARVPQTAPELKLHAARDFLYAAIFGSLPWLAWQGLWTYALAVILIAEIVITMTDFVVEASVRRPFGDVFSGERVTHAVMGIVYGAMLALLIPVLPDWADLPTALKVVSAGDSAVLRWLLSAMAAGVFASGIRDLYAAWSLPYGGWPWSELDANKHPSQR
jgi:hypothetical protein